MNDQITDNREVVKEPTVAELAAEELELAQVESRIEVGSVSSISRLIQWADAAAKYSTDEHELKIVRNVRLVVYWVKRYKDKGLSIDDLIQEGLIGLQIGAERHDPQRGKLSVYASWWIRQKMSRALSNQSRDIRIPVSMLNRQRKIKKTAVSLEQELGRRPSIGELSVAIGLSPAAIAHAFDSDSMIVKSLDQESFEDGPSVGEVLADSQAVSPDKALMEKEDDSNIRNSILKNLLRVKISDRNREIFMYHHNLAGGVALYRTLEATGQRFNLTRERVRQILREVSFKLRFGQAIQGLNGSVGRRSTRKKNRMRPVRVRASPAYIHWVPSGNIADPASAAIEFIAAAYELTCADLYNVQSGRADIVWARGVTAVILILDLCMHSFAVEKQFPGLFGNVRIASHKVLSLISVDPILRSDVDGLRAHFRKVMKLQS